MVKKTKVPVTPRALQARINRRLAPDDEMVRKARRFEPSLGWFYKIDTNRNFVIGHHVDLEELGRELGVLHTWEAIEGGRS